MTQVGRVPHRCFGIQSFLAWPLARTSTRHSKPSRSELVVASNATIAPEGAGAPPRWASTMYVTMPWKRQILTELSRAELVGASLQ
jgi:hypothetical protein